MFACGGGVDKGKTAVHPPSEFVLALRAPSVAQQRAAIGVAALLILGLLAVAPFADVPLETATPFIPAYATAVLALDLIAATLLLAQFAAIGASPLLSLAATYIFVGLTAATWALTFPGAFSAEGLLGGDRQTTAVIAAFRRLVFPVGVLAYAVVRLRDAPSTASMRHPGVAIAITVALASAAAAGITWLAVGMAASTPGFMVDTRASTAVWTTVLWASVGLTVTAAGALGRLRLTVLDLWLLVTLAAFLIEILLLGFLASGVRLTVGWWAGRGFGLAAAAVVALALLAETAALTTRAARSLIEELQARQARATTLEALAGAIAHEMNQPLTAIVTNADAANRWLDRPRPDIASARVRLAAIRADGERAARVVNDLRSAFGARPMRKVSVDTGALLRSAAALAVADARAERVTLSVDAPADLPKVAGNPDQLRQVLLNLLGNAFTALKAVEPARRKVTLSARNEEGCVRVTVSDSGPGMSHEMLETAFEPFRSTKPDGMGLGLMICRTIIEAHGGRITAKTRHAGGVVVEFSLPAEAPRG